MQNRQAEIQELLRSGRHAEAERLLREACMQADANAESWFMLGVLQGMRGDASAAEAGFRKALALRPDFHQARFNLGIALRDQNRLDEARAELENVVSNQPQHAEAHNVLGYVYVRLGRADQAERSFRAALARSPAFPDALTNLGNVLVSGGRWAEAIGFHRRALEIAPTHSSAAVNLGGALAALGRFEEAVPALRQALAANPANVEALIQLGSVFKRLGKMHEAEQSFREALRVSPGHAEARYFLATLVGGEAPQAAPDEYVAKLFDEYAETFDSELVGKLKYNVPEAMFEAVNTASGGRKTLDILDLGCGTGLCGSLFRQLARTLVGVDLSPKMVEKARARGVYDRLETKAISTALPDHPPGSWDLVLAADVFIYIGDLAFVFEETARVLRPGGLLAFSVETTTPDEGDGYGLRQTGRYAHAPAYIAQLSQQHGFGMISSTALCSRMDAGQPIAGMLHVLRRAI